MYESIAIPSSIYLVPVVEFPPELRSQLYSGVTVGVRAEYHDREDSRTISDRNRRMQMKQESQQQTQIGVNWRNRSLST